MATRGLVEVVILTLLRFSSNLLSISLRSCLGNHGVLVSENGWSLDGAQIVLNYCALHGRLIGEVEVRTILGAGHLVNLGATTARQQEFLPRWERLFLLIGHRVITERDLDVASLSEVVFLTARISRAIVIDPFLPVKLCLTLACSLIKFYHLLSGVLPFETTVHLCGFQLLSIIVHAPLVTVVKVT